MIGRLVAATITVGTVAVLAASPQLQAQPKPRGVNGVVATKGPLAGLRFRDRTVRDVYRVIENKQGTLSDAVFERVTATGLARGFARIGADSHGIVFRHVSATAAGVQRPPHLPAGIAIEGTARDVLIEASVMRGFQMTSGPDKYWNGDGFSTERGNRGITFRRSAAWDNTDGGFDLKSTDTRLDQTVAGGNARNYRFWSTVSAGTIASITPVKRGGSGGSAHVWINGKGRPVIDIARLIVRSTNTAPIWRVENGGADIRVKDCRIAVPAGTRWMVAEGGTVRWTLGPTCQTARRAMQSAEDGIRAKG